MLEDIKKIIEDYKNETKRHFDIVAEDLKGEIKLLAEGVSTNTEKLQEHDIRFNRIEDTLQVMKLDLEFIKNELKQKVDRDEFAALEKRVSMLEAKQR